MEQCRGEIGPNKEVCDCKDNDCDGATDESNPDALCADGQRCAGCRCVEFCKQTAEFTAGCPPGLAPDFQPNGECLCIVDTCDHVGCPKSSIMNDDGTPSCAPNSSRVAACVCRAGTCVASCSGVTCQSGDVCDPRNGRCVEDNCRGLGCASQELCDPGSGRCVKDACASADCQPEQVCRAGQCETSCAAVSCSGGQRCSAGSCDADPCANLSCGNGQVCDPARAQCVTDVCAALQCKAGQSCSPSSGNCEADRCWNVKCPKTQTCVDGECRVGGGDTSPRTSPDKLAGPSRLIATGGGGCACSVPGQSITGMGGTSGGSSLPARAAWLLLAVLGICRWRRRSQRGSIGVLPLLVLLGSVCATFALGGCRVSPICINCSDSGSVLGTGQTSDLDAAFDNPDAAANPAFDSGQNTDEPPSTADAGAPSGMKCVPTGPELCNNKDDDCDFKVDEDVVPTSNNCNQVGVCAGAVPVCMNGSFACRYGEKFESTEQSCDGLDNDCNGRVDESFAMLGNSCDVGVGACKTTGVWRCNASGKGLSCDAKPAPGVDEVCNGKDDDCDGMIDEPKSRPGTNPSYVKDDVVKVRDGLWIYKYEASRVDAEASKQGIIDVRTCSRAGVLPWTNVTYTEALAACKSVDMTLCNLDDWVFACESGDTKCGWSSADSCSSYKDGVCNGHSTSSQSGDADSDALQVTGSKSDCHANVGDGRVFDLSGNAKEWTTGGQSPDTNPLRGGSYNNSAEGLRCDFDFALGAKDLRLPNIGFRCCSNVEP
jgi:hypothetical protein